MRHAQGHAQEGALEVDAHGAHQVQRAAVAAQEDVLAVVGRAVARVVRARTTAGHGRGLEERDGMARLRRADGRREAGPSSADDGESHGLTGFSGSAPQAGAMAAFSGPGLQAAAMAAFSGPALQAAAMAAFSGPAPQAAAMAAFSGPAPQAGAMAAFSGPASQAGAMAAFSGPATASGMRSTACAVV